MGIEELINYYDLELQRIYNEKTAGDYTFSGVLAEFARAIEKRLRTTETPGRTADK
jgi:hypothetical protein